MRTSTGARPVLALDAIGLLAAFALWLVCRPYRGVRHDGLLYIGQVLNRLLPERFATDPFFAHGSQDRWSLFSPLLAPLVEHLGIPGPVMVLLCLCQLAFLAACWQLTRDWPSRPLRWAAVLAVIVLPHTYGGLGAFSYAEPFLTARSLAEPLALAALVLLLRGRWIRALLAAGLAVGFHPLITAPVLIVGWIWLVLARRAWSWLGLLLLVPAVAGLAGVAPFDALWHRFDADWFAQVRSANANAFVASYQVLDWMPVAFDALVLILFVRRAPSEPIARLARAMLIAVPVVIAAWALGADVLHDVLLTQVQLWRIFWPMHLLAVLALPCVIADFWSLGWNGRWFASAACLAGLAVMSNWGTGWICLLWAGVPLAVAWRRTPVSTWIAMLGTAASAAAMLAITMRVARITLKAVEASPDRFAGSDLALVLVGLPLVSALIGAGALWLVARHRAAPVVLALALAALAGYGLTVWDQRSAWQKMLEAGTSPARPLFDEQIPAGASVYWQSDLIDAWLLGRRGDYYSGLQGAGLLFSRDNALEYDRRQKALAGIELQREICLEIDLLTRKAGAQALACNVSPEVFAEVCQDPAHPDYFVFTEPMSSPPIASWHAPAGVSADGRAFYLYRCTPRG